MPVTGGTYVQRDTEEILETLEAELRDEWGADIDLTESSVFSTYANALATLDGADLEPAIQEVFNSAYLEDAEGELLDKLVQIVGVERRDESHATGIVNFSHNDTVSQTHRIPNGTTIETDSEEPIQFETTALKRLFLYDDFETGSLSNSYSGDTGNASVVDGSAAGDPSPQFGSNELKFDTTSDTAIYQQTQTTYVGQTNDFYVYLPSNGIARCLFGVVDGTDFYEITLDSNNGNHTITHVDGGTATDVSTKSIAIPNGEWIRLEVDWSPQDEGTITSTLFTDDGSDTFDVKDHSVEVTQENSITLGGFGFGNGGSTNVYFDKHASRSVDSPARAVEGGIVGNIGPNSLTVLPSLVSGVNTVTNPFSMGDPTYVLPDFTSYTVGRPAESDEELRDRVRESSGRVGDGTIPALLAALRTLPDLESISLYENKSNNDNTGSGGLPPTSFEAVLYGTASDQDIAETLFDVKAFTSRDYGGAHGSEVTRDVTASNGQVFTLHWSEPSEITIDMTLDVVVDQDQYIGDDALRDRVVRYIGGELSDGTSALGTGVSENVVINQIEDAVVGPSDTGVIGVDASGSSYTPSTTTDSNGLEVIDIGDAEVATTTAQDNSISLNKTNV